MKFFKPIISVLAILNVAVLPLFNLWSGLMPTEYKPDINGLVMHFLNWNVNLWVTNIAFAIFFPTVFMLLSSFSRRTKAFKVFSAVGFVALATVLLHYTFQHGIGALLNFKSGSISIGTWVALILFGLAFIVAQYNIVDKIIIKISAGKTVKEEVKV